MSSIGAKNIIKLIKNVGSKITNLVYPPICTFCGKKCMENDGFLCLECIKKLEKFKIKNKVNRNIDKEVNYNEEMYMYEYKDIVRKYIIDYKFNDKSYMYKGFARLILNDKKIYKKINSYDIITAVPIHNKRMKIRGYNQSKLVAKEISILLEKDYIDLVEKIKNNIAQSTLNRKQRIENVKDSYRIKSFYIKENNKLFSNKKILIIDDIYTTGSTINEVAKEVSKITKKENIGILTIAKD